MTKCNIGCDKCENFIGTNLCIRKIVPEDEHPTLYDKDTSQWRLHSEKYKKYIIVSFMTLTNTYGYIYHQSGLWTRPKITEDILGHS